MLSFFRKESAPVQLYGKLPIAKDYLRVGCSAGNAKLLRDWLDESFSTAVDGDDAPELRHSFRFLLSTRAGAPIQGTLWPSSDAAGLRRFPFALAVERNKRALLADLQEGLHQANWVWQRLETGKDEAGDAGDGMTFLAAMRRTEIPVHSADPDPAPKVDAVAWSRALWPDDGAKALLPLFDKLRELRSTRGETIRLPLVSNLPPTTQAHAWWRLLAEAEVVPGDTAPSLYFSRSGSSAEEPAFVCVVPDATKPIEQRWLSKTGTRQGPFDFVQERAAVAAASGGEDQARSLIDSLLHAWSRSHS